MPVLHPQLPAEDWKERAGGEWEIWKASGNQSQGFSSGMLEVLEPWAPNLLVTL